MVDSPDSQITVVNEVTSFLCDQENRLEATDKFSFGSCSIVYLYLIVEYIIVYQVNLTADNGAVLGAFFCRCGAWDNCAIRLSDEEYRLEATDKMFSICIV